MLQKTRKTGDPAPATAAKAKAKTTKQAPDIQAALEAAESAIQKAKPKSKQSSGCGCGW